MHLSDWRIIFKVVYTKKRWVAIYYHLLQKYGILWLCYLSSVTNDKNIIGFRNLWCITYEYTVNFWRICFVFLFKLKCLFTILEWWYLYITNRYDLVIFVALISFKICLIWNQSCGDRRPNRKVLVNHYFFYNIYLKFLYILFY